MSSADIHAIALAAVKHSSDPAAPVHKLSGPSDGSAAKKVAK